VTDLFTRPCKVCGKSLQPRQRACCSRRCALKAGFSPRSLKARGDLQRLLGGAIPKRVITGPRSAVIDYLEIAAEAHKALHRRAGWRVCEVWVEELRKAATP